MLLTNRLRGAGMAFLFGVCVSGCAVGPNYHQPDAKVPGSFAAQSVVPPGPAAAPGSAGGPEAPGGPATATAPAGAASAPPNVDYGTWWRSFHDPELESLVERAVQANPDIKIALDRLQAARTYEIAIVGAALPSVEASGAVGRGTGSDLTRGRAPQNLRSADTTSGLQHINILTGFDTTWELDIFGKYRREMEAARADYQATAAQRNGVLVTVIANVAHAYVDLRGLQTRAAVLNDALHVMQESARIATERYQRGITNELDETLANRELAVLQSEVAPVDAQIDAAEYTIATLVGQYPEDLVQELKAPGMVPAAPGVSQAGVPVELLRRRPDVVQAERELAAANARIGVATANLFPSVGITAAVGYQRQGLGAQPVIGQHIWSAGAGAIWPVLDFGSLDAQVEIADLRTRASLVNYRRTIQDAVKDVDTSWTAYGAQQQRLSSLGTALVASQRAVTLANERYERGLTDFLNVVDAQREEYDIQEQYADAQVGADEQFIALFRSLGGGWQNYQTLPRAHIPEPAVVAMFHRTLTGGDALKSN